MKPSRASASFSDKDTVRWYLRASAAASRIRVLSLFGQLVPPGLVCHHDLHAVIMGGGGGIFQRFVVLCAIHVRKGVAFPRQLCPAAGRCRFRPMRPESDWS